MKLWNVSWGYGDLVTMAETKEEATRKFLKHDPNLSQPRTQKSYSGTHTWIPIDNVSEVETDVTYFGE